jgi:ABC-2 type transport system permease protein
MVEKIIDSPTQSINFINRGLLNFFMLFKAAYTKLGADSAHLKSILTYKLIMDDRRQSALAQARSRQKSFGKKEAPPVTGQTWLALFVSLVLGLTFLMCFSFGEDRTTQLFFFFTMYMFMLASSLISDFTSVLIDVRDNYIILPKPVNDRTVVLARLLHIMIHVSKLVLPMAIPSTIFIFIKLGVVAGLSFFVLVLLATLLAIFFINALYIFILRFTTPQRFQNVIVWFQIVFAIFLYTFYQVAPRLLKAETHWVLNGGSSKGVLFAPPYWFAGGWSFMNRYDDSSINLLMLLCAFLLPVLAVFLVVRYLAPSFNRKLSMISGSGGDSSTVLTTKEKQQTIKKNNWLTRYAKFFSQSNVEQMSFLFTWKMTNRSREFKLKTYPAVGYFFVILMVSLFRKDKFDLAQFAHDKQAFSSLFITMIYFVSFLITVAMGNVIYSEKYKAAWWYFVTPIEKPGHLISGAFKSVMVKFLMPMVIVFSILAISLQGASMLANLFAGVCNQVFISSIIGIISVSQLPFSERQSTNAKAGSIFRSLIMMILPVILGVAHYALRKHDIILVAMGLVAITAAWFTIRSIQNRTWRSIKSEYAD